MQCKELDLFYSQKNKLHQSYVDQLNKTMKEYPSFKMDKESTYPEELSKLNGVTKKLEELQTAVVEKTASTDRIVQKGDAELQKLKKIENNLANYTSYEELDITSQQLLADAVQEYTQEKIVFFIKGIVVLFLFYLLYKRVQIGSWLETAAVIGLSLVMLAVVSLYRYFTYKG